MVGEAKELARRMVGDGSGFAKSLRARVAEARSYAIAGLDELAYERFKLLRQQVWSRRKADMVKFGHATGGIGPDLEALYHARGSKFVAH
jgi:hypothetical protein